MARVTNRTYEELSIGSNAEITRTLTPREILMFAAVSGDVNPAHLDEEFASQQRFGKVIAHGMWSGSLISAVLGTLLPGPGTIYLGQTLRFLRPVFVGDTVTARVSVVARDDAKKRLKLACEVVNQDGDKVVSGEAEVIAPSEKVDRERFELPEISFAPR